jgi:hypothetical protein
MTEAILPGAPIKESPSAGNAGDVGKMGERIRAFFLPVSDFRFQASVYPPIPMLMVAKGPLMLSVSDLVLSMLPSIAPKKKSVL